MGSITSSGDTLDLGDINVSIPSIYANNINILSSIHTTGSNPHSTMSSNPTFLSTFNFDPSIGVGQPPSSQRRRGRPSVSSTEQHLHIINSPNPKVPNSTKTVAGRRHLIFPDFPTPDLLLTETSVNLRPHSHDQQSTTVLQQQSLLSSQQQVQVTSTSSRRLNIHPTPLPSNQHINHPSSHQHASMSHSTSVPVTTFGQSQSGQSTHHGSRNNVRVMQRRLHQSNRLPRVVLGSAMIRDNESSNDDDRDDDYDPPSPPSTFFS